MENKSRNPIISVVLPEDTLEKVKSVADASMWSVSATIRNLVNEALIVRNAPPMAEKRFKHPEDFRYARWGDIPLKSAMLMWNEIDCSGVGREPGKVIVVPWPDTKLHSKSLNMSCSHIPLCDSPTTDLMNSLLGTAWGAVVSDGVCPYAMHEALLVIPEYRNYFNDVSGDL